MPKSKKKATKNQIKRKLLEGAGVLGLGIGSSAASEKLIEFPMLGFKGKPDTWDLKQAKKLIEKADVKDLLVTRQRKTVKPFSLKELIPGYTQPFLFQDVFSKGTIKDLSIQEKKKIYKKIVRNTVEGFDSFSFPGHKGLKLPKFINIGPNSGLRSLSHELGHAQKPKWLITRLAKKIGPGVRGNEIIEYGGAALALAGGLFEAKSDMTELDSLVQAAAIASPIIYQSPVLIEEARASIGGRKLLKNIGLKSRNYLGYWGTYAANPLAASAAGLATLLGIKGYKKLKEHISEKRKKNRRGRSKKTNR